MKVSICEDVTVETEVDVSVDDLLSECWKQIEEAKEGERRTILSVVDSATKILAAVPDSVLQLSPPEARTAVVLRLRKEIERWNSA